MKGLPEDTKIKDNLTWDLRVMVHVSGKLTGHGPFIRTVPEDIRES